MTYFTILYIGLYCDYENCFVAVRCEEITQKPINVVTKVGQSFTLLCAGNELLWECYTRSVSRTIAFDQTLVGRCKNGQCSLNTEGGKYELVVKSAVLGDGVRYRCKTQSGSKYGYAEVIVFGKVFFTFFKLPILHNHTYLLPSDIGVKYICIGI